MVGRIEKWMNGLPFVQAVSHQKKTLFSWIRRKSGKGDWCFGLVEKEYTNGNE
jgi:hypothetical protein